MISRQSAFRKHCATDAVFQDNRFIAINVLRGALPAATGAKTDAREKMCHMPQTLGRDTRLLYAVRRQLRSQISCSIVSTAEMIADSPGKGHICEVKRQLCQTTIPLTPERPNFTHLLADLRLSPSI